MRELLKQQLLNGKTVVEKVEAVREIRKHYSEDILEVLKEIIKSSVFYGIGVEVSNTIGAFKMTLIGQKLKMHMIHSRHV